MRRMYNPYQAIKVTTALFCEQAIERDERWNLEGVFRWIRIGRFPTKLPPMEVFVTLNDAIGLDLWQIGCSLIDGERMLVQESDPVLWADRYPLSRGLIPGQYEARFYVPQLELPQAGRYDLHVDVDNEVIELVSLHAILEHEDGQ
jgi:hypothetical protein